MPSVPKNLRAMGAFSRTSRSLPPQWRAPRAMSLARATKAAIVAPMEEGTARGERQLVTVRIPAGWTLVGLVAGLLAGLLLARTSALEPGLAISAPVGTLWLRALQVTIVPLVAGLLVVGIVQMVLAARAGATARHMLGWVAFMLALSGMAGALLTPFLLELFPPPAAAAGVLSATGENQQVPGLQAFVESL